MPSASMATGRLVILAMKGWPIKREGIEAGTESGNTNRRQNAGGGGLLDAGRPVQLKAKPVPCSVARHASVN